MSRLEQYGLSTEGATGPFDIIESRQLANKQYVEISNVKIVMSAGGADALVEIMTSNDNGATDPWKIYDDYLMNLHGSMVLDGKDTTTIVGPVWYKARVTMGSPSRISVKLDGSGSGKEDAFTRNII